MRLVLVKINLFWGFWQTDFFSCKDKKIKYKVSSWKEDDGAEAPKRGFPDISTGNG